MSTSPVATPAAATPRLTGKSEIRIVSHSHLFYWWPVWAVGYLMAIITLIDGHMLAIVPRDTEVVHKDEKDMLVPKSKDTKLDAPRTLIAKNKNLGVIFVIVLLMVIGITNIPLRGLWSVIVLVIIILGSVILALTDQWKVILGGLHLLNIHINLAGYIVISTALLALWLIALLVFDQQIYMIFTPGQLRVRLEIGEGETTYDTRGMTFQKQRSDLFRHWILGLGSGDLIVKTAGAQVHQFDLPNVLFVGSKVKAVEDMMRSVPMVTGQA
jgi:hypothetical protein